MYFIKIVWNVKAVAESLIICRDKEMMNENSINIRPPKGNNDNLIR